MRAGVALLVSVMAACSGAQDRPRAAADLALRPPDQALIEMCPPKPPPLGSLTKAESAARDKARMEGRVQGYQSQRDAYQKLQEEGQRVAAGRCDPLIESLRGGKPIDDAVVPAGASKDQIAGRLNGPIDQLVTCLAFAANSDAPCATSKSAQMACRLRHAVYRKARDPGAVAVIAEIAFAMCQRESPKAGCAALREAVKKGKVAACPKSAEVAPLCAILAGPPSQCPAGKAGSTCDQPEIWLSALTAGRFSGLWGADAAAIVADQALTAAAASGKADSCAPLVERLRSACLAVATPPLPDAPLPPQDVPGAVPLAPKKEGATTPAGTGLQGAPAPAPMVVPPPPPPPPPPAAH